MMRRTRVFLLLAAAVAIVCSTTTQQVANAQSDTPTYSVTDIGTLGSYTSAYSMNNLGHVTGQSRLAPSGPTHAFVNIPGLGISDLGVFPGGHSSAGSQVNDAGQIVGVATDSAGIQRAFFWTPTEGMQDIGYLAPGFPVGSGALNNSGQICGSAWAADTRYHAYLWTRQTGMTDLGTLGGVASYCADINESGQVAGNWQAAGSGLRAFRYVPGEGGGMSDLGTLGGSQSLASAINNSGVIVGSSYVDATRQTAFVDTPGSGMSAISIGASSNASFINDAGTIVGGFDPTPEWWDYQRRAFIYTAATGPIDMGTLGGDRSYARGLNAAGVVVGESSLTSTGPWRAFVYRDGVMTDLNTLIPADAGVTLIEANAINDRGWILATGQRVSGEYRVFLLKPGPFFTFSGFLAPVDNLPIVNSVKAGTTIPVKFSLGGDQGLDIVSSATSVPTACDSTAPVASIDETTTAGASTLSYDASAGVYKYGWKTEKTWTGCRYFLLTLSDGNTYSARFRFDR